MPSRPFNPFVGTSFVIHAAIALSFALPRTEKVGVDTSGETFNLPEPIDTEGVASPPLDEQPSPSAATSPTEPLSPSTRGGEPSSPATKHAPATPPAAAPKGTPSPPLELYGAVGDRSAADITLSFTSNFPSAASADPIWQNTPFGSTGEAMVTITIDEAGRFVDSHISGGSEALRGGIARTLSLIRGRAFTAQHARTTFFVSGSVSPDTVHDGLHGDYFAVGRAAQDGRAFFALPTGRRIDIRVRAKR